MFIAKEEERIESIGQCAWAAALDGKFRVATRLLKKIGNSFCVSESERVTVLVEARHDVLLQFQWISPQWAQITLIVERHVDSGKLARKLY